MPPGVKEKDEYSRNPLRGFCIFRGALSGYAGMEVTGAPVKRYHGCHIVFVEGGGELEYVEVARAVDIAHGASPRVTVVLMTPKLKKAMQIQ